MIVDEPTINTTKNEPATLPGPASYEEELKDYSDAGAGDLIDNLPDAHPEPKPHKDE